MPRKLLEWRAKRPCASAHHRQLSAYLDGEIDGDARACVEQHLAACSPCRAEYEQLRFASRALSHFIVPNVRQPVWQIEPAFLQRQSAPPLALWLKRFCAMKIAVPAPVFVVGLLAAITLAALLLTRPLGQMQTLAASPLASVPIIETKIVEVPVEREVMRERIVTRTVYVRQPRSSGNNRENPAAGEPRLSVNVAGRVNAAEREQSDGDRQIFVRASVEGFRPVTNANLRIVKEPEQ